MRLRRFVGGPEGTGRGVLRRTLYAWSLVASMAWVMLHFLAGGGSRGGEWWSSDGDGEEVEARFAGAERMAERRAGA